MNTRIKEIRNKMKCNQQQFADFLGVSVSNIQSYETARRVPSEAFISLICEKCNVNEEWLRSGTGDMCKPIDKEEAVANVTKVMRNNIDTDNEFQNRLLELIASLSPAEIDLLREKLEMLMELKKDTK